MKTVLLLGGPAAGQRVEVHGAMRSVFAQVTQTHSELYNVVPMCSHGEVHWFGVLDGADPLALLIAGYAPAEAPRPVIDEQKALDEFIARAGFTYGWKNLESWARRMAEQAVAELGMVRP